MTKIEETSLSIVNKAFANEFTEPTCQLIPQRNANLKDQIQIKPVIAPMIPTPVNESYPTCFILAWLIPLIIVIAVVLIFLQYESWSIIPFALAIMIVIGLIYQVKSKYRGRQEFLAWVKCCCLCCDFRSNLKLATTIRRYEEDLTLSKEEVTQVVFQHPFLVAFMDELCMKMPEFYFSFLISGSLRERFGKMLPSKSVLGTDFDIMLLPDGAVAAYPNQHKESPLFLIEDKGTSDGFVWLKLNNHFLTQWDKLCLKKHIDNGSSYLSSHYLTKSVEEVIKNSSDIRTNIKKRLGFNNEDIKITAGVQGPALKVEVEVKNKPLCYSDNKPIKLFEADFTLAIQCPYWPDVAKDFFENANRRINWPDPSVIKEIKKYGCHLTPKQSTDALVKIESNQSENTTFGKTQFLEWRFSFSQAEIILSDKVPDDARTAFLAVKAVNKRHFHRKGAEIKSYVLKCIFLSMLEKTPRTFWENSDRDHVVEVFFLEILKELKSRLEKKSCPNFWIEGIDLFDFQDVDYRLKLDIVNAVISNPRRYVADNYLEFVRCYSRKCCYSGPKGYRYLTSNYQPKNINESQSCICCSCSYTITPSCCGPSEYNRVAVDVY